MLIVINPYASSGKAIKKWNSIEPFIKNKYRYKTIKLGNNSDGINKLIQESIDNGEREFAAAGGDGTVNFILNSIMEYSDRQVINDIKIGAVGLGSSNDFHKPFQTLINNIPYKINFEEAKPRDVCFVEYPGINKLIIKYFIINASVGLTAFGNCLFNYPNKSLTLLKKLSPSRAIYYAALMSIAAYKNIEAKIESKVGLRFQTKISNLGIIKSPHFSGNLSYNSDIQYDDGLYSLHLSENLTKLKSLELLWKLNNSKEVNNLIKSWVSDEISISAEHEFEVEFDGETIKTNKVRFGILQKKIKVCAS